MANSAQMTFDFPTDINDCIAKIDAGFGTVQAKQVACQAFLANNHPESLEALAMTADMAQQFIYAGWCRAKANYLRSGTNINIGKNTNGDSITIDPSDDPPFPSSIEQCRASVDAHMSVDQKQATCLELFNEKNNSERLAGFSEDAKAAGYPIASMWFSEAASKAKRRENKTYYIAGGVAATLAAALVIGIAVSRN